MSTNAWLSGVSRFCTPLYWLASLVLLKSDGFDKLTPEPFRLWVAGALEHAPDDPAIDRGAPRSGQETSRMDRDPVRQAWDDQAASAELFQGDVGDSAGLHRRTRIGAGWPELRLGRAGTQREHGDAAGAQFLG